MNRQILERSFLSAEIRQREGSNGTPFDYVEGHTVLARLNEAFDGIWSFEVRSFEINESRDEVMVLGILTAGGVVKMQFGRSAITRGEQSKMPISVADDLKAATTDAIKKCATLFGVGLHLYAGKSEPIEQNGIGPKGASGPNSPSSLSTGRLSSKQHGYILTLSRERGLTRREVDALCQQRFGVVLDHVTRAEASSVIDEFSGQGTVPPPAHPVKRKDVGGVH